ncbi:hypothetical protein CPB84DRAFT_1851578 [Gymnopilus junonius]|uniref:Uncharacterized protein n=1 Tax=Gymnopilus junonius TaxID=109634 RepID=A0A9P5NDP7_GYMJU|nr:hypothetical protein CPB84DRAFT_1851578 [Gymnopilus junonius]
MARVELSNLAVLRRDESFGYNLIISAGPAPSDSLRQTSAVPEVFAPTPFSSSNASDVSPAWDPSSRTPGPDIPLIQSVPDPSLSVPTSVVPVPLPPYHSLTGSHWLQDVAFSRLRLKARIRDRGRTGEPVDIHSIQDTRAQVLDRYTREFSWVDIDSLVPLHPVANKEAVTPLEGTLKGEQLVVKSYGENECVVRKPGVRLRKGESDPVIATGKLVRINPGLR